MLEVVFPFAGAIFGFAFLIFVFWLLTLLLRPVVVADFMTPVRQRFHAHDLKYGIRFGDQHNIISSNDER